MWARIVKVLSIGDFHGHDSIALGAWGGDAFGNDANKIAALFERALRNNFQGAYRRVIIAIGNAFSNWNESQRMERVERLEQLERAAVAGEL
jgi:uncharacterized protein (TIGR02452 family)